MMDHRFGQPQAAAAGGGPDPAPCGPAATPAPGSTRFKRGLLWFSVIFGLIFLADLAVVGNLIFRDLSRQVIEEAKASTLEEARNIARNLDLAAGMGEVSSPAAVHRVVRDTVAIASYAQRLLERYTFIERIRIVDAEGREIMRPRYRRAVISRRPEWDGATDGELSRDPMVLQQLPETLPPEADDSATVPDTLFAVPAQPNPQAEVPGLPANPHVNSDDPTTVAIARMNQIPLPDLAVGPGSPSNFRRVSRRQSIQTITAVAQNSGARVELAVSEEGLAEELAQEIDQLRRDLILKILIGAGVSILLLVVAYVFVVKLFNKTRRLESEAQMADRLAYVGTLAAGLAHEIRNPLSAMKLNLQVLDSGLDQQDSESRDLLRDTQGEVDRLGGLVTSFLSYARPASLELAPSNLNDVVTETIDFLRGEARLHQVDLRTDLSSDLPLLSLDVRQVRQAILNIVHNAMAAVEGNGGGRVTLRTETGGRGEVRLAIEDDGPGISREKLDNIFQVFYSSKPGGTGLGLPIAQRVLEGHGGRIEVESRAGSGTRFMLIFPLETAVRDQAST